MELFDLLRHCVDVLESLRVPYFVTGSLASVYYGEPRLTNDIDIVIDLQTHHVARFCRAFSPAEYYVSEEAVREAVAARTQFNVIHPESGLKADMLIASDTPFGRIRFERAVRVRPTPDQEAWFSSAEDVILKKLDFYREGRSEKHLRDIAGMLKVSGGEIDENYIAEWAKRLGVSEIWEAVRNRLAESDGNATGGPIL